MFRFRQRLVKNIKREFIFKLRILWTKQWKVFLQFPLLEKKTSSSLGPDFCENEKRSIFFVFEDSFERFLSRLETKKVTSTSLCRYGAKKTRQNDFYLKFFRLRGNVVLNSFRILNRRLPQILGNDLNNSHPAIYSNVGLNGLKKKYFTFWLTVRHVA